MAFLLEVSESLLALLHEGGRGDPTFQRLAASYGEVATLLGCRAEYERMLRGLLASGAAPAGPPSAPCAPPCGGAGGGPQRLLPVVLTPL